VLWLVLSVGSALFQVLRNMVMKRLGHALDETINVWGRFTFILPFAAAPLLVQGLPPRQPGIYWYCFLFAVTQITGTQCLALALKVAEISLVTALWKLSVVLLVVWGYLTLGEEPSFLGVVGVLVCVAGVYLINVSRARVSLWAPLVSLIRDPGQRYTLGAALFYAPSVVIIKKIALLSSPTYAVFMGYLFCSVLITPWVLYRSAPPLPSAGTALARLRRAGRVRRAVDPARDDGLHDDRQLLRRGRQADRDPAGAPHRLAGLRRGCAHPPDLARLRRDAARHRHPDLGKT
jgi:drug/metabolite transporter (DMT)-like permease